jgi:hypothetical protein
VGTLFSAFDTSQAICELFLPEIEGSLNKNGLGLGIWLPIALKTLLFPTTDNQGISIGYWGSTRE